MEQEREGQEAKQEGAVAAHLGPTGGSGASVASQSLSHPDTCTHCKSLAVGRLLEGTPQAPRHSTEDAPSLLTCQVPQSTWQGPG